MAGGSSDTGRAVAELLAVDGAAVTITGPHEERLAAAQADLVDRGHPVWAVACDSLVSADLAHAVSIAGGGGRLDIAVSVPGGPGPDRFVTEVDEADFMAVVDRTLRPVLLLVKHAGQAMDGGGAIVAVSSAAAVGSMPGMAAHAAASAAVDSLVRVAADELGSRGVRVNSVRPRAARRPGARLVDPDRAPAPTGRGQGSDETGAIARAIRFLAGPESSWITGQSLAVDRGPGGAPPASATAPPRSH